MTKFLWRQNQLAPAVGKMVRWIASVESAAKIATSPPSGARTAVILLQP
jgi:hypothetical protein